MKRQTKLIVLALIVVGALVLTGAIPLLELTSNTEGKAYYHNGWEGNSQANGGGDLLDTNAYVTSWTGGGTSEKIVIVGKIRSAGGFGIKSGADFERYYYKVKLDVDSSSVLINGASGTTWQSEWFSAGNAIVASGWTNMNTVILSLTNPCSGKISVEFWGHHHWDFGINGGTDMFASDEANLRSGVGSVKVQNDQVEEGQSAHFYVETSYAHSTKSDVPESDEGWFLNVYSPTGTKVFSKTIADDFSGTVDWLVPMGSYSATSSNVYKVVLRNELINQDDDWFFTLYPGGIKDAPELPTFELTKGETPFHPGDQITVKISATKKVNPIAGFWVWVSYETSAGTTTEYIYEKAWFPATATATGGTASVTFTWPDAGHARLEASAADSMNLNSGNAEMKFTIYGGGGGGASIPFDWTQLIIVIAVLAFALIAWFKLPIGQPYKAIVVLVLIALAFYFAWPLLTTDYSTHATWIKVGR